MAYLGYRAGDDDTPWGSFFNPEMAPLPRHVVAALEHGPQADQVLLGFDDAATILDDGYQQTENGYGALRDGGIQVSVRTDMPGVTPADVGLVVRLARQRLAALQAVASARARLRALGRRRRRRHATSDGPR